jgi:N-acetylneuraminate lyase
MGLRIRGLVAAAFTPLDDDGQLRLAQVQPLVEWLVRHQLSGVYVNGSTGEGPLLTGWERQRVAEAFVRAAAGRLRVIVQVGHNSLQEARELARHAQEIGADAVSAAAPGYFRPDTVENLIDCLAEVAAGAPDLPFYYYHIPSLSGVGHDMVRFLELGSQLLPTLVGVKYTAPAVYELQACVELSDRRYNLLFGVDEMLLSGLCAGADGAVGSTFNLAPRLYQEIVAACQRSDLEAARKAQAQAVEMVRILCRYRGQPGIKAAMQLLGLDCGPNRLPQRSLSRQERDALRRELEAIGFFNWSEL